MRVSDTVAVSLVVLLWGFNLIVIRVGVQEIPPLFLTSLRLILVTIVVVPFFRLSKKQLPVVMFLGAVIGVGHFGFMFLGLREIDSATAVVAVQFGVPLSAVLGWWVFGDRLSFVSLFGMVLSLCGIVLLAGEPAVIIGGKLPFTILVICSGAVWAISNVVVKCLPPIHPMVLNGWLSLCAAPLLLILSVIFESDQWENVFQATWRGWGAVIYTAIGSSLIAHTLWYRLVTTYPLSRTVPITALVQVVGVAGGVIFLGETMTYLRFTGCMMTAFGVILVGLGQSSSLDEEKRKF